MNSTESINSNGLILRKVTIILTCIQIVFWLIVFIVETYAMIEFFLFTRSPTKNSRAEIAEKRIHILLYIVTLMTLGLAFSILGVLLLEPGKFTKEFCHVIGLFPVIIYCIGLQALYAFFVVKVELVSGFERGYWYKKAILFIKFVVAVMVPFVLIPVNVISFHGEIDKTTGYCIHVCRDVYISGIFIVGNAFISFFLVFLFVEPIRQNAKNIANGGVGIKETLMKVVRINVKLCIITVVTTTMNAGLYFFINLLWKDDTNDYLFDLTLITGLLDLTVNGACGKLMSFVWLPVKIRKWQQKENHQEFKIQH